MSTESVRIEKAIAIIKRERNLQTKLYPHDSKKQRQGEMDLAAVQDVLVWAKALLKETQPTLV